MLAVLAVVLSGCGLAREPEGASVPTPTPDATAPTFNLLANPGFEDGVASWTWREDSESWVAFGISDGVARHGDRSLELRVEGAEGETGTRIAGAVQEVRPPEMPQYLSGWYRVEDWQPNAPHMYVQFVVIVWGANFGDEFEPHEIRLPIVGIENDPFTIGNSRWLYLSRETVPVLGEWVYFGYPLRAAFEQVWNQLPENFERIEFLFEVRYDGKTEDRVAAATVYFDDLYVGPFITNPNRPDFIEDGPPD